MSCMTYFHPKMVELLENEGTSFYFLELTLKDSNEIL